MGSFSCDFLPRFQPSDAIKLQRCGGIVSNGHKTDTLFLFRVLKHVKRGAVSIKFQGFGIDCSPVNGIAMAAVSTVGKTTQCKAFAGDVDPNGNTTCSYSCGCSSGCVMFRVTVTDPADKIICPFVI